MLTDPAEDYARGSVPFLDVKIYLDSHPLIPRTETEYWVEKAIAALLDACLRRARGRQVRHPTVRVLDLFAGSGAIGLAVMKHVPGAHVTFADINPAHFPTILKSIGRNGFDPTSADFVQTDVWLPILDVGHQVLGVFDMVLANPPYVSKERGTVSESALAEEPHEALFAEDDGFALIARFIRGLPEHLAHDGQAWLEHEQFQSERIHTLAGSLNLSSAVGKDQYGVERFTRVFRERVA